MTRYVVQQSYRAERDGDLVGPWAKGDEIDLDDDVAAFVNVDSPGTLAEPKLKRVAKDSA